MRKEFKKSFIVFDIILAIVSIILLLNIFITKNTSVLFCGILATIAFIILSIIFGYERKNRRFTFESMFYTFAYTIVFLLISYILGIFTGFTRSIYSLSFSNIVKNVLPFLFMIVMSEYLRSEVVRKCEGSFISSSMIALVMILIDCTIYLTTFDIGTGDGKIYFICSILLPSVAKNVFLIYLTHISGVYPPIIYRILMEIKMFIVPISPSFGLYIESILDTVFPILLGFIIHQSLKQYKNPEVEGKSLKQSKLYIYLSVIVTLFFVIGLVTLTSCKFQYGAVAIGSGSMTGTINKGDVAIYKRLDDYEIQLEDIIVFRKDEKIIIHRVIEIVEINDDEFIYYTKGDANADPDGYPIARSDIIGVVKSRVKYLGMPSVAISEIVKK